MASSAFQFMVTQLVFQVICREKIAGVFYFLRCFQFDFSLLVKTSRLMLKPYIHPQTGHSQTAHLHIF